jgi:hypothetical protein
MMSGIFFIYISLGGWPDPSFSSLGENANIAATSFPANHQIASTAKPARGTA